METIDEEVLAKTTDFIKRAVEADTPFFTWFNVTRMHVFTHLKEESDRKTGKGLYPDGMVEHDGHVGQLLDLLDELKIADNTIAYYSTDYGAEIFTWPDGGTTPFHGEIGRSSSADAAANPSTAFVGRAAGHRGYRQSVGQGM